MTGDARQRAVRLIVGYSIVLLCWIVFARWAAPGLIVQAQQDHGLALFERLIQKPGQPGTSQRLLDAWREFSGAVAWAILGQLAIVLLIRRLDSGGARQVSPSAEAPVRWTNRGILVFSTVFLAFTVVRGSIQDYAAFESMWREVLRGHDPWFYAYGVFGKHPLNAYGPLFNLLAIPAWVHPLLPKLLFALLYLAMATWLIKAAVLKLLPGRWFVPILLLFVWFWLPYAWVEIANYGHFDVLVGLSCAMAIEARRRGRDVMAGTALAAGMLLKFMPLVLLPFLAVERGRVRFRLLAAAIVCFTLGMGASALYWGPSTFRPVFFAAGRSSHHLSIYRFLKGRFSPRYLLEIHENPDEWAPFLMVMALALVGRWAQRRQIDAATSAVVVILVTLMFYQVGFPQYQMVLFVLISYWALGQPGQIHGSRPLGLAFFAYFAWLSVFDLIECRFDIDRLGMQEWIGLPTFLMAGLVLCCLAGAAGKQRQTSYPEL
ncbi:MAG: glycosyltransferase 87 family protein [Isosphaeraceae bacterium]